jgi:23S rRNA (adenine1618-N6)-methyltransferase
MTNRNPPKKVGLHPRNRHQGRYNFLQLKAISPELTPFLSMNQYGDESIDFSDPKAVKTLNRALLKQFYGILNWDVPPHYLCPPIPGRADYIHHIADLLASCNDGIIPTGESVRVLDVGVGANCIYPIIGHCEYGWKFLGSDIDTTALDSAKTIIQSNKTLESTIELRLQSSATHIFKGLLQDRELIDLSICNPPFHSSLSAAQEGTRRKWKNLKKGERITQRPILNFGGKNAELWCKGGEEAFIRQMIAESTQFAKQCFWFSTLVSKQSNLPQIYGTLRKGQVQDVRTIEMAQGQKKSRIIAWTFLTHQQQLEWRKLRWKAFYNK